MKIFHLLIVLLFSQAVISQRYTQVRYMASNQTVDEWRRGGDTVFIRDTVYVDSCRLARDAFKRDIIIDSFMVASSKIDTVIDKDTTRFYNVKPKRKVIRKFRQLPTEPMIKTKYYLKGKLVKTT